MFQEKMQFLSKSLLFLFFIFSVIVVPAASPVEFFGAKAFSNGGSVYYGMENGDFNGDEKPDVLTVSNNRVLIFYGDGNGEFFSPPVVAYSVQSSIEIFPVAGDFNSDGRSDFALPGNNPVENTPAIAVFFGNSDKTFSQPTFSSQNSLPQFFTQVDFDNDGKLDLLGRGQISGSSAIIFYKNSGNGIFTISGQLSVSYSAENIVTGDFNNDNLPDISYSDSNNLKISQNLGNGSFGMPVTIGSITYGFNTKVIADVNNDGKKDIVAVQKTFSNPVVAVWLGNGNFTFTQSPNFIIQSKSNVYLQQIADVNNDQKQDLIFSSPNRTIVSYGLGNGTFAEADSYIDGGGGGLIVRDLNADGWLDIAALQSIEFAVAGSGSFSVLLNLQNGSFRSAPTFETGDETKDIAIADFNADQLKDFVIVNSGGGGPGDVIIVSQTAGFDFNRSSSQIRKSLLGDEGLDPYAVVAGDFNQDNKKDIIVVGHGAYGAAQNALILINLGNNNFAPTLFQIGSGDINDVAAADFNSDGKLDLVTSAYQGTSVSFGAGNGTFGSPIGYFTDVPSGQITIGDFNNDNKADIAVIRYTTSNIGVLINNGAGTFVNISNFSVTGGASGIASADMNSDGKLDLIVSKSNGVSVINGVGTGSFNNEISYQITPVSASNLSVADFNGDGKSDVALLAGTNTISILLNNGAGGLNNETLWGGGVSLSAIAADDLNNDQKVDLICGFTSSSSGYTKLLFNLTEGQTVSRKTLFDYDGDGKADVSIFRPSNGVWYLQQSTNGFNGVAFGLGNDKLAPADYDGDGKTDIAVVRNGTWYLLRSQLGFIGIQFGDGNDVPVPADYDGDSKADLAVFRPSNGVWYLQQSTAGFTSIAFGTNGDKPIAADYDGDGKADIAVNRAGTWYIQRTQLGFTGIAFGGSNDKLVPADYDGDGKADIAVFRPSNGTWYLQQSTAGFTGIVFGAETDVPAAADYDGDGKSDIAVFRPSNGVWYLNRTSAGFTGIAFGDVNDKPTPNAFVK